MRDNNIHVSELEICSTSIHCKSGISITTDDFDKFNPNDKITSIIYNKTKKIRVCKYNNLQYGMTITYTNSANNNYNNIDNANNSNSNSNYSSNIKKKRSEKINIPIKKIIYSGNKQKACIVLFALRTDDINNAVRTTYDINNKISITYKHKQVCHKIIRVDISGKYIKIGGIINNEVAKRRGLKIIKICGYFNNQISFNIITSNITTPNITTPGVVPLNEYNNKRVNIKIFYNGSMRITGCKSKQELRKILQYLYAFISGSLGRNNVDDSINDGGLNIIDYKKISICSKVSIDKNINLVECCNVLNTYYQYFIKPPEDKYPGLRIKFPVFNDKGYYTFKPADLNKLLINIECSYACIDILMKYIGDDLHKLLLLNHDVLTALGINNYDTRKDLLYMINGIKKYITIILFRTGNIIITGGTSNKQLLSSYTFINKLINKYGNRFCT